MRDALKGILPEQIRTRRDKIGWNAPLHEWFNGTLKNEIEKMIEEKDLSNKVKNSWQKFQKIRNPIYSDGEEFWTVLMPELWIKNLQKNNT